MNRNMLNDDGPLHGMVTACSRSIARERQSAMPHIWAAFVYGTLKRGQRNHDHYCRGALSITPATTWGRLYALPAGYPAMEVPERHILAHGTANPLADATTQALVSISSDLSWSRERPAGDWDLIHGEIITFTNPLRSLPPIDRLEGFHPGRPSLYDRVLLPVQVDGAPRLAWTYTMTMCSGDRRLLDGVWR